ncbi:MAG: hypothetical protein HY335_09685 [Deinococcus sp.]|nr:hypothetical protein [Deinococcus sp.]
MQGTKLASRQWLQGLVVLVLIALTGCRQKPATSTTPAAVPSTASTAQTRTPQTYEVKMAIHRSDQGLIFAFEPDRLQIAPGDTVRWVIDSGVHSSTAYHPDNGRFLRIPPGAASWDSGNLLNPGNAFEHVFQVEGVYDYMCTAHEFEGMLGAMVVGRALDGPGLSPLSSDVHLPDKAVAKFDELTAWAKGLGR